MLIIFSSNYNVYLIPFLLGFISEISVLFLKCVFDFQPMGRNLESDLTSYLVADSKYFVDQSSSSAIPAQHSYFFLIIRVFSPLPLFEQ